VKVLGTAGVGLGLLLGLGVLAAPSAPDLGPFGASGNPATAPSPQEVEALWREAGSYPDFLADARRRQESWEANTRRAAAPSSLLRRLDGVDGSWRILAVAEDWCGDSVHTLPYLAALADAHPALELRVIDSRRGRALMEGHRTPDGRAATPTFVLLDAEGRDRGCLVERPPVLQEWFLGAQDSVPQRELYDRKYAWYEEDAGAATMEELVTVVETAARGAIRCVGGGAPGDSEATPSPEPR
jgi:hypothetical protein